jgi:hypothetical protein
MRDAIREAPCQIGWDRVAAKSAETSMTPAGIGFAAGSGTLREAGKNDACLCSRGNRSTGEGRSCQHSLGYPGACMWRLD